MPLSPIPEILQELKSGRMIVLVDDEDRENEGDLVLPAEKCSPQAINFISKNARGLICLALTKQRCEKLQLRPQTNVNTARLGTDFTVSVDAHPRFGVSTGISVSDQAKTIEVAIAEDAQPQDLLRPGHVHPVRARNGGVLVRNGQTEGSVDLVRLAGFKPAAVICEIMRDDGEMARRPELEIFCQTHGLKMCAIADLVHYRMEREKLVQRIQSVHLPTRWGDFQLYAYRSLTGDQVGPNPSRIWRCARAGSARWTQAEKFSCTRSRCWCGCTVNA